VNTTTESVVVNRGHWRISTSTLDIYACRDNNGVSPCLGGSDAGTRGNGYCAAGHFGPKCESCLATGDGRRKKFQSETATCEICPETWAPTLILIGVVSLTSTLIYLCYMFLYKKPPAFLKPASDVFKL
jgi:hypothetical protein